MTKQSIKKKKQIGDQRRMCFQIRTSTVGLPRLSKIWRALTTLMTAIGESSVFPRVSVLREEAWVTSYNLIYNTPRICRWTKLMIAVRWTWLSLATVIFYFLSKKILSADTGNKILLVGKILSAYTSVFNSQN